MSAFQSIFYQIEQRNIPKSKYPHLFSDVEDQNGLKAQLNQNNATNGIPKRNFSMVENRDMHIPTHLHNQVALAGG
ncbi:hypothetical protein FGO68_gene14061 [Halteria grandinella]|uniref:Uncharacterized protein n=1 Tax=Halteria grandinella TaxID=5974 RepID=A0A8J8P2U6_HALGN|nr:hypothetical protein FGO68_gene14061 [Halteria grandinella]